MEVLNIWDQQSLEITRFYKKDRTSSKHSTASSKHSTASPDPLQQETSQLGLCLLFYYYYVNITAINCINTTFIIITFNSVVGK